ncbi:CBS domain-containing protein [Methanotorris formicicus]|uniref:CBS domain containing membrane protein n=1 Tax=Methanotorris formicicus Mc-S-70 TaxID=647171 RepID=H1KYG0_9EURY|nr:CBS domain-containing protein [Methanotorris formicicus]EHP87075.1 CBS domain containing membrane protein [Methanotorris formicicus Mc-S-70]
MFFKKLSTIERIYNIGLELEHLDEIFEKITKFLIEFEEDIIKTYASSVLNEITVENIMTKDVLTVPEDMNLEKFEKHIREHKHLGYPVVDENDNILGIVTFNDLKKIGKELFKKFKVKDVMTPESKLVTVSPKTSAADVQKIMWKNDIGRILVVDDKNNLLGIVTKSDLLRASVILLNEMPKITECKHITNFYFYDRDASKINKLADDMVVLLGARGYIVSEKEGYIEILTRDWEPLAKIMKSKNKIEHITITTKTLNLIDEKIAKEVINLIEKYAFEEIIITDHITLINERSSIIRVITDITSFRDSKKTFGTVTIRIDF